MAHIVIRGELSHKCEHSTAQIEAQLRGSSRIRAKSCMFTLLAQLGLSSENSVHLLLRESAGLSHFILVIFLVSDMIEKIEKSLNIL